jgi:hypothetical protein
VLSAEFQAEHRALTLASILNATAWGLRTLYCDIAQNYEAKEFKDPFRQNHDIAKCLIQFQDT